MLNSILKKLRNLPSLVTSKHRRMPILRLSRHNKMQSLKLSKKSKRRPCQIRCQPKIANSNSNLKVKNFKQLNKQKFKNRKLLTTRLEFLRKKQTPQLTIELLSCLSSKMPSAKSLSRSQMLSRLNLPKRNKKGSKMLSSESKNKTRWSNFARSTSNSNQRTNKLNFKKTKR